MATIFMRNNAIWRSSSRYVTKNNDTVKPIILNINRSFGMRKMREHDDSPRHPNYTFDSIQPPKNYDDLVHVEEPRPEAFERKTPTSAYSIDVANQKLSARDAAWVDEKGVVVHGRYGELSGDIVSGIPLEYLPLLRPGADGAAAVREITKKGKAGEGTMLVFGASEPSGLAALQFGTAAGLAVVGVVGGEHSGNDEMVDYIKGLTNEPGFAVAEEHALVKKNFQDLVMQAVNNQEIANEQFFQPEEFVKEFHVNTVDYSLKYPPGRPALHEKHFHFRGIDHERKHFTDNWEAYYEQFEPGSPSISLEELQANFSTKEYATFKQRFSLQAEKIMAEAEDLTTFFPANFVKDLCGAKGTETPTLYPDEAGKYYNLNIEKPHNPSAPQSRPILGLVLTSTPSLLGACKALTNAKTLREKAETLQTLHFAERNAYAAAASCIALAKSNNAPVYVVGNVELPGLPKPLTPLEEDVSTALKAMQIDENEETKLKFFVQVYRACDWPIYEQYAIHRASEVLAGPRQIIVAK